MREIRTSGSVRGGGGNVLTYSARGLEDRPRLAFRLIEPIEPGISVGLQDTGEPGQVPLGIAAWIASYVLLARAVRTFQERRRQRLAGAAQCKGERRR